MTHKEKIDTCLEQARLAYQMHNDRRQWEWKVTLGLWAVILTTVVKDLDVSPWIWAAIVLLYGILWLRPIWVANENNKSWYDHFMREADVILQDASHEIVPAPGKISGWSCHFGFLYPKAWSMLFQFVTTAILAWIAHAM